MKLPSKSTTQGAIAFCSGMTSVSVGIAVTNSGLSALSGIVTGFFIAAVFSLFSAMANDGYE